jgi:hypothetical protein
MRGEDRRGGVARAGDGGRSVAALRGSSEPDLRLEEAAAGAGGTGVCERERRSGVRSRARDRAAACQDRAAHRGARFFSQEVRKMSAPDRRALVDRGQGTLPIRRQCTLLGVARSGVYRPPPPANENDLALMRRIDELFTAWPFLGSRQMAQMLGADGRRLKRSRHSLIAYVPFPHQACKMRSRAAPASSLEPSRFVSRRPAMTIPQDQSC